MSLLIKGMADHGNEYHTPDMTQAQQGGENVWVQALQPVALEDGDIWIETE